MTRLDRLRVATGLREEQLIRDLIASGRREGAPEATNTRLVGLIDNLSELASLFVLREQHAEAAAVARDVVRVSETLLFGAWRRDVRLNVRGSGTNEELWRSYLSWWEPYRIGAAWAACLRDWDALMRLSQYPADDASAGWRPSLRSEERAYYLMLAKSLRGRSGGELAGNLALIEKSRKKRPKLLATAVQALLRKDARGLERSLTEYLEHHRVNELPDKEGGLSGKLALDASFILHWAARVGMPLEVPAKYHDVIVPALAARGAL